MKPIIIPSSHHSSRNRNRESVDRNVAFGLKQRKPKRSVRKDYGGRLYGRPRPRAMSPSPARMTACNAGDDHVKDGDDAGDDGLEDCADAVDNGHEATANCAQDGLNLLQDGYVSIPCSGVGHREGGRGEEKNDVHKTQQRP